ncbi:magnesium-dependent phosphatase 1-like [Brevipalpus obovatus]|uniref:magnesium-dependent phosphatase 1-like n=1 Tax=Brevipalpus obovatus TaxID=246614 RepID=UPI003D9E7FF3
MKLTSLLRQLAKPRIACVDLDYTLWPWGVDQFVMKPPYKLAEDKRVVDATGKPMPPFPEAQKALEYLRDEGIQIAGVSRTTYSHGVIGLIWLYGWSKYFEYLQAFPAQKWIHLAEIQEQSGGVPYNEMILFDDEQRNIDDITTIGVMGVKVDPAKGLTVNLVEQALKDFSKSSSHKISAKA